MHQTLYQLYTTAKIRSHKTSATLFDAQTKKTEQPLGKLVPWNEVKAMYESAWEDEWFDSKEEQATYHKAGLEQLKAFYEHEKDSTSLPFALEEPFMLKVDTWQIKGAIDRIDVTGDTVELIDYKTGSPKEKMDPKKEETLQLRMYQLALMQDKRFADKAFTLSYYFLTNGKKVSFTVDEQGLTETKEHIIELCKAIEASDFAATPSPYVCGSCDFYDICQFRAEKR